MSDSVSELVNCSIKTIISLGIESLYDDFSLTTRVVLAINAAS